MPFHVNQVGKLPKVSPAFYNCPCFYKNPILRLTECTPKHKKIRWFYKPESLEVPSPEEEGVNQLKDKEALEVSGSHERVCQDFSTNLHIPGKS